MKYNLRPMKIEDIETIVCGEEKVFGHSLGYDMIYADLTINPYAAYMVLEIDKNIHGYVGMWVNENAEIINLYVDKEYQGYGFGGLLMDFVIDLCIMSNIENLTLEVRRSNIKAISLYEKYQLEVVNERLNYYSDGEDALVMMRVFEVIK